MSKFANIAKYDRECTKTCSSKRHVSLAVSAITKRGISDRQLASYLFHLCSNVGKISDTYFGISTLHMAASCGRHKLAQWLVSVAKADINLSDAESGYSPLHRSIYYGHINTSVKLIQMGANMDATDYEGFTPLEFIAMDRNPKVTISKSLPCDVYIWGLNNNDSIGTGTGNARKHPELLNKFKKDGSLIIQVAMDEFHSVFVSNRGKVWSCGHGQGGRLGTGSDKPALTPVPVSLPNHYICVKAEVAVNHTLLLLSTGKVLSFGLNTHHQLGIIPYIKFTCRPEMIYMEPFDGIIKGMCAAKYHSVFYTTNAVYTCGTNAGQLGHKEIHNTSFITVPKKVPLHLKEFNEIKLVASSYGATVVLTKKGEIFCFHQYQIKKITSINLNIVKMCVVGGTIDNKVISDAVNEELKIAMLTLKGTILLWKESINQLIRCICQVRMGSPVTDICLTNSHILFTTATGEGFQGKEMSLHEVHVRMVYEERTWFQTFLENCDAYRILSKRIQNVHRAVAISSDPKGKNLAVLQVQPNAALTLIPQMSPSEITTHLKRLLEEASLDDPIHDVIFSVNNQLFPAHRYMLNLRDSSLGDLAMHGGTVPIDDVDPYIFNQFLLYIYTGDCEILHPGPFQHKFHGPIDDPVKQMLQVSCKYKTPSLTKKLSALKFINGNICLKDGVSLEPVSITTLSRTMCTGLYDIKLEATDGVVIDAHKCVLVARLEYFNHMLNGGWIESGPRKCLKLQFHSVVLRDVIDFLYTDEVPELLSNDEDFEYVIRLLIAADQLFINNLREACEVVLCNSLSLKNAASLLQLAVTYNAVQLKTAIMEFISLNLDAVLESRILEYLGDDILDKLGDFHRANRSEKFMSRVITPSSKAPTDETILKAPEIPWPDEFEPSALDEFLGKKKPKNAHNSAKKRTYKKSISSPTEEQHEIKTKPHPEPVAQPTELTPPHSPMKIENLWTPDQFPTLDTISNRKSVSPRASSDYKRSVVPIPKLSQKQKQKMVADCEMKAESPPEPQPKRGWGVIPALPDESLNHFRNPLSPTSDEKDRETFADIMANQKEQRSNLVKMREKSLTLIQTEDRAMEELSIFYNASNSADERITIQRVLPTNIATPTWITSHRQP